jgi:hypothetical protein
MFESFYLLDRDRDAREFEGQSPRSLFLLLLVALFVFGMLASMTFYGIFHLHHFNWGSALALAVLGLPSFRIARQVYRSLER